MRGDLAWSGAGFEILVREEDATGAREVLTPTVEGERDPGEDVQSYPDTWPPGRRFT
jgi:hypothetical protein